MSDFSSHYLTDAFACIFGCFTSAWLGIWLQRSPICVASSGVSRVTYHASGCFAEHPRHGAHRISFALPGEKLGWSFAA